MLNNIPPILSPELLKVLCEMGHGDVCASTSLERCIGLLEAAEGLAKTIWLAK